MSAWEGATTKAEMMAHSHQALYCVLIALLGDVVDFKYGMTSAQTYISRLKGEKWWGENGWHR